MRTLDNIDVVVLHAELLGVEQGFRVIGKLVGPEGGNAELVRHPSVKWWIKKHASECVELALAPKRRLGDRRE